ncbi:helix-hairpin-helix domain-containing protein [Marinifilum flexuosum]|uniref:DNA uptake protein ComE-like DNA-binding protein n=1 Tax=Marinifilum flexuosum TaxID=1117708 RepID=A0A419WNA2_9BACT|nr:helix-hairpin-helix domain-containing protein [Marinifilum flexuosum]RKD96965.1 DNA uptake protein ComE-like DNA-binding protein [Marinifilum flexuosum]
MSLKKIIKEYFSYSTSEKRGLLVLALILITVFVLPKILNSDSKPDSVPKKYEKLDSIMAALNSKGKLNKPDLFLFDPNKASADEFKRLGLRDYQTRNILKYRDKGGVFRSKSDFRKIYGIKDDDYNRLKDYISITVIIKKEEVRSIVKKRVQFELFDFDPNTITKAEWERLGVDGRMSNRIIKYLSTGARFKRADDIGKIYGFDSLLLVRLKPFVHIKPLKEENVKIELVDLNMADTSILKTLPGIGKILSNRIVKYKDMLGGYISKSQLLEVYGISEETFQLIENRVCVSPVVLKKISINDCNAKSLGNHPYISRRMSSDIVKYRERVGKFSSVGDLKTKHLLTDSVFKKIQPYLSLE